MHVILLLHIYTYVQMYVHILFHYRFDFVVITSTFIIELFETNNPVLIFVIPLRFLRFVCTYGSYYLIYVHKMYSTELGKLLYESNILLHITSYSH